MLKCGHYAVNFSRGRCIDCARVEDANKRIAEFEQEEDYESWQNLRDDLDAVFSKYIRVKYSDSAGMLVCYTSGRRMTIAEAQCGHFIPRQHLSTRWHEDNCRPQSKHDNEFLQGNLDVFRIKLEAERKGLPDYLSELSRQVSKPTISELKELLNIYRNKLRIAQMKLKP